MRKLPFISLLVLGFSLLAYLSSAQIISTYAGNGFGAGMASGGYSGDGGLAINAELNIPLGIVTDSSGNIYIAEYGNYRVRLVSKATGIISTVAGNGTGGYSGDGGLATDAELQNLSGIAFDPQGNYYIADEAINVIRKVTISTGIITTIAGNGFAGWGMTSGGFSGDGGPATAAELYKPYGVAIDDSGNIFIADWGNNRIRKITSSTGIITTIAGNDYGAYSGDGGLATVAELHGPSGVAIDSAGNVYIADFFNNEVRKITVSTGIISSVAGNHTIGGGYSGDGGQATDAEIETQNISVDRYGNLYIPDGNSLVREVKASTGVISTIAGIYRTFGYNGDGGLATAAKMFGPADVAVDNFGYVFIADVLNNVIRKITNDTNTVTGTKQLTINNGELTIYPNPNNGKFTLQINNGKWIMDNGSPHLEIYNILGEQVYSTLSIINSQLSIDLSAQPNGIYFYRVISETGKLIGDGKIIIEK